jgi:hypothetical protein
VLNEIERGKLMRRLLYNCFILSTFLIFNITYAEERYTITGDISFRYDGDIYVRLCAMEEWSEFLRPNYELSAPPWKIIKLNSETKKTGNVSFKLNRIPTGTYVIVAFQDVIKNQKVDYEGLHMTEPYGTYKEDDYVSGRPRWDYVKFNLKENIGGIKIRI